MPKQRQIRPPLISLRYFRERLAHLDALPQLALLGLITGLMTGALMVLFLSCLNYLSQTLLGSDWEDYEHMPLAIRLCAPLIGCLLIFLLLTFVPKQWRAQGIGHVIERFSFNQGRLPWQNGLHQFFSATIALSCGLSAGREGPAVHMGACVSSWLGQKFRLPNNCLRILVGCGSAAAIGASFNTPIAGVIFAMEVIMAEYTVVGFTPIILASVSGTALSQWLLGQPILFHSAPDQLSSLIELPWVAASGILIGCVAALFLLLCRHLNRLQRYPLWLRVLTIALLTAGAGFYLPVLMGTGYDLVNLSFAGEISLTLLLVLAAGKLLLTGITFGLGIPIGIIGPMLVIGGLLGAATGHIGTFFGDQLVDEATSPISVYAMIGMAAMMGASLQAPLAALMALLELTNNPHIIMPGMLAVISATLACRHWVPDNPAIFHHMLAMRGLDVSHPPLAQAMSRIGVTSVMEQDFLSSLNQVTIQEACALIERKPQWLLITDQSGDTKTLMPAAELANHLYLLQQDDKPIPDTLLLSEIPAEDRLTVGPIDDHLTLTEAYIRIADIREDALYIINEHQQPIGILTNGMIERYYT